MNCHSKNAHLGDLLWTINALSRIPERSTLRCNPIYHEELREYVKRLPLTIDGVGEIPHGSYDCWIASGQFPGVDYRDDIDILGFVARYFNAMTSDAGFGPVFKKRESLLDWVQVEPSNAPKFDGILVINCDPKSGQCSRYSSSEMDAVIERLEELHPSVLSIQKAGLTISQIAQLSITAKLIIGCATGPWWPTVNFWNRSTPRIVMLDPMRLDYGPNVAIEHAACAADVSDILHRMGYL